MRSSPELNPLFPFFLLICCI
ncbi:hypothetical protein ACQ27_gp678 [Klebsiella phage K64-1]|nr:hypothetical protein ACQ27_gp678 [Klebsiella phage K64-1]